MNQIVTQAIILSRTDYGEADRILTVLTPEHGKLRVLAKGVRKVKSKLAGGIELFSVSTITYIPGRGDIGTLVSTRLVTHYGAIVHDLERTMLGYELIKQLNKATEDETEAAYFELLLRSFAALDDAVVPLPIIRLWFGVRLLKLDGHLPNIQTDTDGRPLEVSARYAFDLERMAMAKDSTHGRLTANHIKFLRLTAAGATPNVLAQVRGGEALAADMLSLVRAMTHTYMRP